MRLDRIIPVSIVSRTILDNQEIGNSPGTEKRTTFLSAHSLEASYLIGIPQEVTSPLSSDQGIYWNATSLGKESPALRGAILSVSVQLMSKRKEKRAVKRRRTPSEDSLKRDAVLVNCKKRLAEHGHVIICSTRWSVI